MNLAEEEGKYAILDGLILERVTKMPGAMLADINTGLITNEASLLDPGNADKLVHQRLQRLKDLNMIYQKHGHWYIK